MFSTQNVKQLIVEKCKVMKVYLRDKQGFCHPVEDLLIAVQSKVLRRGFQYSEPSAAILPLPEIDGEILDRIISWVNRPHPETLDLDKSEGFFVCDLILASEFLDMPVLRQQIISWVEKQLSSKNVLDLWIFSKGFLIEKLQEVCWQFLMKHLKDIKLSQLKALDKEDLLSILTSDDLRMKEESVWKLASELEGPNDDETLFMECVRYGLLEESFWTRKVLPSSKFQLYVSSKFPMESPAMIKQLVLYSPSGLKPRMPRNLVFLFGGFSFQQQLPSTAMTVLDPSTGVFGLLPISFPTGYAYSGAVLDKSTIYIAGGFLDGLGPTNSLFKLNLEDLSLSHLSKFKSPRNYVGLTKIGEDIFVVGGHSGSERQRSIEKYSIAENQWFTYEKEMVQKRSDAGVAALNGKIYVVGGFNGFKQFRSTEIFDPQTGTWSFGKKMIKRRSGVKLAVKDGKLYVVGGWSGGAGRLSCGEVFDPRKNSWSALPEMRIPRSNYSIFVADGRLMVAGGYTGSGLTETVEYLDEEIMKWKFWKKNLLDARSAMSSVSVPVDNLSDETLKKFRDLCVS